MSDAIARFNAMPPEEAEQRLLECFANRSWAGRVAAGRPYQDLAALLDAAESAWPELAPSDWLEVFAAHPRIGERGGHSPVSSEREQSKVMRGSSDTLADLASANRRYEARFGHLFLISASGLSAEDILGALRQRLENDPMTEINVAAGEHRKITRLRLEQLLKT